METGTSRTTTFHFAIAITICATLMSCGPTARSSTRESRLASSLPVAVWSSPNASSRRVFRSKDILAFLANDGELSIGRIGSDRSACPEWQAITRLEDVLAAALSPDGKFVWVVKADRAMFVLEIATNATVFRSTTPVEPLCASWDTSSQRVIAITKDRVIAIERGDRTWSANEITRRGASELLLGIAAILGPRVYCATPDGIVSIEIESGVESTTLATRSAVCGLYAWGDQLVAVEGGRISFMDPFTTRDPRVVLIGIQARGRGSKTDQIEIPLDGGNVDFVHVLSESGEGLHLALCGGAMQYECLIKGQSTVLAQFVGLPHGVIPVAQTGTWLLTQQTFATAGRLDCREIDSKSSPGMP